MWSGASRAAGPVQAGGRRAALAAATALMLAAAACQPPTPAAALRTDPEAIKRGKSLFVGTCAGYCHSPTVERAAPNLFDCAWNHGEGNDQELFDIIAAGIEGTAMIGFRGKLPEGDDDIWRLVAYLGAARPPCSA